MTMNLSFPRVLLSRLITPDDDMEMTAVFGQSITSNKDVREVCLHFRVQRWFVRYTVHHIPTSTRSQMTYRVICAHGAILCSCTL